MSLKAVEMQIALPKTFEAGKMVDQANQHNQLAQSQAASEMEKETERKRKSVVENNAKKEATLENEENVDKNQKNFLSTRNNKEENNIAKMFNHPYKGNTVDYSG